MDNENKEPKKVCTKCLYTGEPSLSVGRLLLEFTLNILFGGGTPLFQKVRHCPMCGSHSMVAASSEAGQAAIEKLKSYEKEELVGIQQGYIKSSQQTDFEWTRIRSQR